MRIFPLLPVAETQLPAYLEHLPATPQATRLDIRVHAVPIGVVATREKRHRVERGIVAGARAPAQGVPTAYRAGLHAQRAAGNSRREPCDRRRAAVPRDTGRLAERGVARRPPHHASARQQRDPLPRRCLARSRPCRRAGEVCRAGACARRRGCDGGAGGRWSGRAGTRCAGSRSTGIDARISHCRCQRALGIPSSTITSRAHSNRGG